MDSKVNKGNAEESSEPPKETHVKPHNDVAPTKKSSKELRKVDDKSVEYVMKALNTLHSPEEKLAAMCKKYTEIVDENRKLQANGKQWEKKYVMNQREKEQLQLEYNKTVLLKAKLENLCRELQKQNKAVKDESLLKIREEEERRNKTQAKFQTTLTEITALMQQNNDKSTKLRDDNLDITKKFKSVMEQYELQEQQVDKMSQQMELESQLHEAKLNKSNLEAQAERERHIAEKSQLLENVTRMQALITEMRATEVVLKCQVSAYSNKYDEFQNALTKSNEVFGGFRGKMEKMQKKILKLEKETTVWKQRWEKSHAALLDMAAEKQQRDARTAVQGRQLGQLQKLCRTMQADRATLLKTLQDNNIERPPLPQLPEEPEIPVPTDTVDRVDAMAANCAQLKLSLAQLQGQLNVITAKSAANSEEAANAKAAAETPAPAENVVPANPKNKSKKGKGKKNKQNDKDSAKETQLENLPVSDVTTPEDVSNEVPNFNCPEIINDVPRVPDLPEIGTENISPDLISAQLLESISSPALAEVLKNISSPVVAEALENMSCPAASNHEQSNDLVVQNQTDNATSSVDIEIGNLSLPEVDAAIAELLATVSPPVDAAAPEKSLNPTFSQMLTKTSSNISKVLEKSSAVAAEIIEKIPSPVNTEIIEKALSNTIPDVLPINPALELDKLDKSSVSSKDAAITVPAAVQEKEKAPTIPEKIAKGNSPVSKKKGKKSPAAAEVVGKTPAASEDKTSIPAPVIAEVNVSTPAVLEKTPPATLEAKKSTPAPVIAEVNVSIPAVLEKTSPAALKGKKSTSDPVAEVNVSIPAVLEKTSPAALKGKKSIPVPVIAEVNVNTPAVLEKTPVKPDVEKSIPTPAIVEVSNPTPVLPEEPKENTPKEAAKNGSPKSPKKPASNTSPKKNKGKGSPKNGPTGPVTNGDSSSPDSNVSKASVITEVPKVAASSPNAKKNALPAL